MDKKIIDKRLIKPRHWKFIIPGFILLLVCTALVLRDPASTLQVDKEKITIEKVQFGAFEDFIRLTGVVEPISEIFLVAAEGGIVEEILIEEGSMVEKGEIILRLSNPELEKSILDSEIQLVEYATQQRESYIRMDQQKLNMQRELLSNELDLVRKKREYEHNTILHGQGFIPADDFLKAKEDYELALKLMDLNRKWMRQDSILRQTQIKKINLDLEKIERNMEMVYKRKNSLSVKAPFAGQLGRLNATLGESIGQGQRIGQVNVLTSYKVKAQVDEHYIDRVRQDLTASFDRQDTKFGLKVRKVYPAVRDGRFEIDLVFTGELPENIRTGQSYHLSLQLGETQESLLLTRGGFFQSTGGQWVYVLTEDGKTALKRSIRIGKQNPRYYEVLEGLEKGEKVITSGYDVFGDNDKLVLN